MSLIDDYVRDVLARLPVSPQDRARIESDLRDHLNESVAAGDTEEQAVRRMGPPSEVAAELMSTLTPLYGAPASRLGAMIFDTILVQGTIMLVFLGVLIFAGGDVTAEGGGDFTLTTYPPFFTFGKTFTNSEGFSLLLIPLVFALSMLPITYFVLCEWLTGRTIGKWLFGLTVTDDKGQSPSFLKALVRRLSIFFGPAFLLDGASLLLTEKRQRASELVAHTVVLRAPEGLSPAVGSMGVASAAAIVATAGIIVYSRFIAMLS